MRSEGRADGAGIDESAGTGCPWGAAPAHRCIDSRGIGGCAGRGNPGTDRTEGAALWPETAKRIGMEAMQGGAAAVHACTAEES